VSVLGFADVDSVDSVDTARTTSVLWPFKEAHNTGELPDCKNMQFKALKVCLMKLQKAMRQNRHSYLYKNMNNFKPSSP
jgi:hypothetical protein